jgi:hypothetical protein
MENVVPAEEKRIAGNKNGKTGKSKINFKKMKEGN